MRAAARILGVHHNTLIYRFSPHCKAKDTKGSYRFRPETVLALVEAKDERINAELRTCADCGATKPTSEFSLRNREKHYYSSYCKPCNSARTSAYNKRNPERIRENHRRFVERNPEKIKEYNVRNHARHRGARNAYFRQYRAAHRETRKQLCRDWYAKNKERARETMKTWRALHRDAATRDPVQMIQNLLPQTLPSEIRDDICGDILLSIYEGTTKVSRLKQSIKQFVDAYFRQHREMFSAISLSTPLGDDWTLGDTIAAQYR